MVDFQYDADKFRELVLYIADKCAADPKFGVSWSPIAGVNVRGTYGTSFKVPLLSEINQANVLPLALDLPDPNADAGTTPAIVVFGSGMNLEPEQAT